MVIINVSLYNARTHTYFAISTLCFNEIDDKVGVGARLPVPPACRRQVRSSAGLNLIMRVNISNF